MKTQSRSSIPPPTPPSPVDSFSPPRVESTENLDVFESSRSQSRDSLFAVSPITGPELVDFKSVSGTFNLGEVPERLNAPESIAAMQEIAVQNSQPLQADNHYYLFERSPNCYSLNEALQALGLNGALKVKLVRAKYIDRKLILETRPEREQSLNNLSELSAWWVREREIALREILLESP